MVSKRTLENRKYLDAHPEMKAQERIRKRNYQKKMMWHDDPVVREKFREAARERVRRYLQRQKERRQQDIVDAGSPANDEYSQLFVVGLLTR
jgi:hypothetical protein